MEEQVKVLLVTTEEPPTELEAELVRLGVMLEQCEFADAEDRILEGAPDLVALSGARGAVELSTILEDVEDGPHMVIVAERKELAKLRGLNRDIVGSLFAVETTEKVVGQRIESLARRAARKKSADAAPAAPAPKKTALGLPTGSAVAKMGLKKSPPGIRETADKAAADAHPGTEPSMGESTPKEGKATAQDAPEKSPAAPPRPFPSPAREDRPESVMVLDEELLESISPSEAPVGAGQIGEIPRNPALPA